MACSKHESILREVNEYYSAKIQKHGATFQGVDWNSFASQQLRFEQIAKVIDQNQKGASVNDLGCGYGAFFQYLKNHEFDIQYRGYDVSGPMIDEARRQCASHENDEVRFFQTMELQPANYTVASGVFGVKGNAPNETWLAYCLDVISEMDKRSSDGIAFNMLTSYSEPEKMQPNLYYADPKLIFDFCMARISKSVAILHDYGIYEFTVLARK